MNNFDKFMEEFKASNFENSNEVLTLILSLTKKIDSILL